MTSCIRVNRFYFTPRDRLYIMSAKEQGGLDRKIAIFAKVQYLIYVDIVGGSEKVKIYADIIWGWSPT